MTKTYQRIIQRNPLTKNNTQVFFTVKIEQINIFLNFKNCVTTKQKSRFKFVGLKIFYKYNAGGSYKMDVHISNLQLFGIKRTYKIDKLLLLN